MTLGARVVDTAANRAVNNIDVLFLVETDVFGPRLMQVGKATTDATGTAYVTYKPSWEGDTAVVVRFLGNSQYAAGEGKFNFSAVGPANVHQDAAFGLESNPGNSTLRGYRPRPDGVEHAGLHGRTRRPRHSFRWCKGRPKRVGGEAAPHSNRRGISGERELRLGSSHASHGMATKEGI